MPPSQVAGLWSQGGRLPPEGYDEVTSREAKRSAVWGSCDCTHPCVSDNPPPKITPPNGGTGTETRRLGGVNGHRRLMIDGPVLLLYRQDLRRRPMSHGPRRVAYFTDCPVFHRPLSQGAVWALNILHSVCTNVPTGAFPLPGSTQP